MKLIVKLLRISLKIINMENKTQGIGLGGVLFVVFLVLKLTGHIDWSWWWVTSPLWIGVAFLLLLIVILTLIGKTLK